MVGHAYNPSTWEAEVELLQVTSQLGLYCEFKPSLGYGVRPCLKTEQSKPMKTSNSCTKISFEQTNS